MKIAILHAGREDTDLKIAEYFISRGIDAATVLIGEADFRMLAGYDAVINRVYASTANWDYRHVVKTMELVARLSAEGKRCVNGPTGSTADYDKFRAFQLMRSRGVATPETRLIGNDDAAGMNSEIQGFADAHGFPVILKRNTGGRGLDVQKIDHPAGIAAAVQRALKSGSETGYAGRWLVQQYMHNDRPHDGRIMIMEGRTLYAYGRTFIPTTTGGEAWFASVANGSKIIPYEPTPQDNDLALAATRAIEADCNEVDIAFTPSGEVIIENNPTPNFIFPGDAEIFRLFCASLEKILVN